MTLPENPLAWAVKAFGGDQAARYSLYRRYLNGDHNLEYATTKFRQAFGRLFEAFGYNRCSTVVDAHADRLRIAGFGSDDTDTPDAVAQIAENLWNVADMDIHAGQLEVECAGLGDAYLLVTLHPDTGDPVLWPQPAEQMRVHWDEERPNRLDLAAKLWHDDDEHLRLNLYFTDRIEKYRTASKAYTMPSSPAAFVPHEPEGEQWPVMLPVKDTVPVFHFPNNGRINSYGTSELRDVIPLQDALNKSLMDQMVASEFAAAPQRVILGYDASDPESEAALSNLVTGVTRMLAIPAGPDGEVPSLAEFSAANMQQYDLVAEKWDIRISRVSKVPVHHLTQTGIATSGRALRIAEAPFVEKLVDRQRERGPRYANAIAYALRLMGASIQPGDIRINWEPAAPMSEEDAWEVAGLKAAIGWPITAIAREMGRDPEEIQTILEEIAAERERALSAAVESPMFAPNGDREDDEVLV